MNSFLSSFLYSKLEHPAKTNSSLRLLSKKFVSFCPEIDKGPTLKIAFDLSSVSGRPTISQKISACSAEGNRNSLANCIFHNVLFAETTNVFQRNLRRHSTRFVSLFNHANKNYLHLNLKLFLLSQNSYCIMNKTKLPSK